MSTLFELDDFTETRTEWQPIGQWGLCGLCGSKGGLNQGSSTTGQVCDPCAKIDRCDRRDGEGRHVSHWGEAHEASEHDALLAQQAKRRARFLASQLPNIENEGEQ